MRQTACHDTTASCPPLCRVCPAVYLREVRDELAKFAAIADVQARAAAPSDDADGEFRDGVVDLNGGATDNPRAP